MLFTPPRSSNLRSAASRLGPTTAVLLLLQLTGGCSKDTPGGSGSPAGDGGGGGTIGDGGSGGTTGDGGGSLHPDASMPPPGTTRIRLEPATVSLETDGLVAATQTFTVVAEKSDGTTEVVTPISAFALSPSTLGTMRGATFETMAGGRGRLTASLGGLTAEAAIEVVLRRVVSLPPASGQPPLPQDPAGPFTRAPDDPARAPELVYPNDGVLLPPNLGAVEVHYRPGSPANTLFELSFTTTLAVISVYTRCDPLADGCVFVLGQSLWTSLSATEGGGEPIVVRVRGTDDAATGKGASAELRMSIAPIPVQGGLYYWTTSNGSAIMRVDFDAARQTPERFFPFQGGGCYGCHALSRNGRRMTLSQNGQRDGRITLLDVASQNILLDPALGEREQFQSWNPTSDRFAGVYGDADPPDTNIRIRDGNTGLVLETIPIGNEVSHPDWSPRGDRITFTFVTHHYTSQRPGRGGLSYVAQAAGGAWGPPVTLLPPEDGKNRYYPAYSPDAQLIVYNESTCPPGELYTSTCDGDADPSAILWAIPADGGAPIRLDRANAPGVGDRGNVELSTTFPKWAPFTDSRTRDGQGRVMWFTFSSRRAYGLRTPVGTNQLLWMAAVDPDALLAGRDGSTAAFALPFQDLSTSNHIAQWTTRIVPSSPDGGIAEEDDDAGTDPGMGGECKASGDPCDPARDQCCGTDICTQNGPGIYLCRPNL